MAAQEARISALHSNLHLLDSHKDDLRVAVADASGAAERAAGTTTSLEARVRALQVQIRERDNTVATLKEVVIDVEVCYFTADAYYSTLRVVAGACMPAHLPQHVPSS